jgi:alkanesulfonate monooxygenase SsuD/methylene tetrahydromethanopterin reductase-like flavin-dependent oxidoreductase (luciferase family)
VAGEPPEFGVYLPQVALDGPAILERALVAEEVGLDSLWFYDHLYSPGQPDLPSLEAWTLASWVLARTERLRVGHLVLCNSFRHPALLAKMAATLDVLSGGRVELGLGSGSVEAEHREAGLPWGTIAERSERLGEALGVLTAMFEGGPATFTGTHYKLDGLPNVPTLGRRPRVHVGGNGPRYTLPLVARHADVWSVPTYGLADWEESRRRLDAECAAIGREPSGIRTSHEAVLVLAPDEPSLAEALAKAQRRYGGPGWGLEAGGYIGTPAQVAARITESAEKGVSLFIFFTHDRADPRTLELFAERVVPELV